MKSKKRGFWWYDWYSICSRHHDGMEGCRLCETGEWICRWKQKVGHLLFKLWPWAWRKWANRKNSPRMKRLKEWFPGLDGQNKERKDGP